MLTDQVIQMAAKVGIQFPTMLPLFSNPPNLERMQEWAESQTTPMLRNIAHKLVDNCNYISFEQFLINLQETVADFNQAIGEKPYVLLIAENRPEKLRGGCSDLWVAGLALEHCGLHAPTAIHTLNSLQQWIFDHPEVEDVLVLDDASYSGTQKSDALESFHKNYPTEKLHLWMGIPFLTAYAKKELSEFNKDFKQLHFLKNNEMASVMNCLNKEDQTYIKNLNLIFFKKSLTLTWFDHRFPDFKSAFRPLNVGSSLLNSQIGSFMNFLGYSANSLTTDDYNQLATDLIVPNYRLDHSFYNIPQIIPPYYLMHWKSLIDLRGALAKGLVGPRTSYVPQDETIRDILRTPQEENAPTFPGYKKTQLELVKQEGFDTAVMRNNWTKTTFAQQQGIDAYSSGNPNNFYAQDAKVPAQQCAPEISSENSENEEDCCIM